VTKPDNRNRKHARIRRLLSVAAAFAIVGPVAIAATAFGATAFAATASGAAGSGTVSYRATDDAYTSTARVALNTGGSHRLVAGSRNGDRMITYLKFAVGALGTGTIVTGATVTLTRDEHRLPGRVGLSGVVGTGWSERTLTKVNAPAIGATANLVSPDGAAATVTFDVAKLVKGTGTYTFAVTSPATDDVARFHSAEYGADTAPKLTLTTLRSATVSPTRSTNPTRPPPPNPTPPAPCTVDAKLVPTCGVLWGAAAGGFTTAPRDQALKDWEATTGRTASIYHTYHTGDQLFPTGAEMAMAREVGRSRLLMLNWKVADGYTWAQVARGAADARINTEAAYLKATFAERFFLVIHHEPENDVDQAAGSGMNAKDYAAMFRHVVERLRAAGVTNAVSTVTYMSYEKLTNQPWWYDLYPGDAWVDWIALDAYVNAVPGGFHNGDFRYLVDRTTNAKAFPGFYTWVTAQHRNKPFMVSEWGVFDDAADPSRKAAILAAVLGQLKAMPAIKGLMYFDARDAPGAPGDLRVDSSAQSLREFKKIAADPIFKVKVN
jgi:hypothetical protein